MIISMAPLFTIIFVSKLVSVEKACGYSERDTSTVCVHTGLSKWSNIFFFFTVEMDDLPPKIKDESRKTIFSLVENTFLLLNYAG